MIYPIFFLSGIQSNENLKWIETIPKVQTEINLSIKEETMLK